MKASRVDYLVDAGPLVGAFWARDQWHEWSRGALASLGTAEVFTTETAFAEAAYHLRPYLPAVQGLLAAVEAGRVKILPIFPEGASRCSVLMAKYSPRIDLGDASLIILSEKFPQARLITVDLADFTIYRRADGRPVALIAPKM